jgi:2-amino-4-hydroxy-6-hydroxymethyldihydropteridine diphosphokinase
MEQAAWELYLELGEPVSQSSMYETAPWGFANQGPFLNRIISYQTSLRPVRILELAEEIEKKLGRKRFDKWGPRTIDIDILFYGNIVYESPELQIPHPHLHERRFALAPMVEIRPDFVHPILDKTIEELYNELDDELTVKKL